MSSSLIFLTGGTGFIGSHVTLAVLKSGYRVRLSVRRSDQEAAIMKLFPAYRSQIETVVIPDITRREAFVEALKDVDHVFHLASPMPGQGVDVRKDYVDPAVHGTTSMLYAALDYPQIKNIIVMSSILALVDIKTPIDGPVVLSENTGEVIPIDLDMKEFEQEGMQGHGMKYRASKILAHQATRDFLQKEKPSYTVLTFHPSFVLGEDFAQESPEQMRGMMSFLWMSLSFEKPILASAWVHVEDVAKAHVNAITTSTPIASGTEFILSAPPFPWEEAIAHLEETYPFLECKLQGPFGPIYELPDLAAENILGIKWTSKEKIMDDVMNQQLSLRANHA
ncbi:NAD(P)-binding protein [Aureobasidium sp. EXF-12298]|nr:NAD(P)-binding protein [Aureobasidium sp. EXF-12298]